MGIGIGLGIGFPSGKGGSAKVDADLETKVQALQSQLHTLSRKEAAVESKQLSANQIFNAENRGEFTGSGSLKNLGEGWWYIPSSNTNVTGKPKGSTGDILVYRRAVGKDGVAMLAFGNDKEGGQVWGQYKTNDTGGYLPWVKMTTGYIFTIDEIVGELKKRGFEPAKNGSPVIPLATYYAGYDTTMPTKLSDLSEFQSSTFSISRTDQVPERIFIATDVDHAKGITGISVNGGLPAVWPHRDYVIGGKSMRVFYSPGGFHETSDKIEIKF